MPRFRIKGTPHVDQSGFRSGEQYDGELVPPQPGSARRLVRLHRLDANGQTRSLTINADWVKEVAALATDEQSPVGEHLNHLPDDVIKKFWNMASDPPDEVARELNPAHDLFAHHFPDFSIHMDRTGAVVAEFTLPDGVRREARGPTFGAAYAHAARLIVGPR